MVYAAHVFTVFIASPGDVGVEREAVAKELESWNRQHRHSAEKTRLEARRWELDAVPEVGSNDVQAVINEQLVDDADILVAIFHSRLGSRTQRDISGTVEELNRMRALGKPVHVYFSQKHLPIGHDPGQLRLVLSFQRELKGYAATFDSTKKLRERVRDAVTRDVDLLRQRRTSPDHDPSFDTEQQLEQLVGQAIEYDLKELKKVGSKSGGQQPSPEPSAETPAQAGKSTDRPAESTTSGVAPVAHGTVYGQSNDHQTFVMGNAHSHAPNEDEAMKTAQEPNKDRPEDNSRQNHWVAIVVALIGFVAVVTAAIIPSLLQNGGGNSRANSSSNSPGPDSSADNSTYLIDLDWHADPSSTADHILPGLAIVGNSRFPHSFTHNFCDQAAIEVSFDSVTYGTLAGHAALRGGPGPVTLDIFYQDSRISGPWILLWTFSLGGSGIKSLQEELPPETRKLRLEATGDCTGTEVIWAYLVVE
jgi:hypothetical protein